MNLSSGRRFALLTRQFRLLAVVSLLAFAAILAACGGDSDKNGDRRGTGDGSGGGIRRGGTLVVGISSNPIYFDPMLQNDSPGGAISSQIFEGLYTYDEDLKPKPWLAETINISQSGLEYVFHLRKDVKFYDGTEMDAEAVKFSVDRVRSNPKSVGYADGRTITDTTVVDKYTFKISLSEPFAPFPSRLTGRLGAVVSPTAVKAMGDEKFNENPVGTGPFKFVQFRSDSHVRLAKFENYWRQGSDGKPLPYLDGVEFRVITEAANRLTALQAGDIHTTSLREADIPVARKDTNIVIDQGPGFGWGGIWLTINKPPFDNKALRQAVAYAIDRDAINKAIYEGQRTIANGPIPPVLSWAVDPNFKSYPHDLGKARQLLIEGGRANGFEFEYWISAGDSTGQQLAELIQSQLAQVGIKVKIEAADFNGVVIPKLQKGESNAYQLGLTGGVDPDQHVAGAFAKGGSFNFFPYENSRVDELIRQGRRVTSIEERAQIYKEAVRAIMEDVPYIFTVYGIDRYVGLKKVKGWFIGVKATTGYSEFWLSE